MKKIIILCFIVLLMLCSSCERKHKNIFDPENEDTVFLKAPENLTSEIYQTNKIKLNWSPIEGITTYKIDRCLTEMSDMKNASKEKNWQIGFITLNSTSFTDTLVNISGTYEYRVYGFKTNRNTQSSNTFQNIVFTVANPTVSLPAGNFNNEQTVVLAVPTSGAQIRYTTDGTDPVNTSSLYSLPIKINASLQLKVKAFKQGWVSSQIITRDYKFSVKNPVINLASGTYDNDKQVNINTETIEAEIHYTMDGTEPTIHSALYATTLPVNHTQVLKVKAFKEGYTSSQTISAQYQMNVAQPILSLVAGTYTTPQQVALSCVTQNALIRYTTNGTEPDTSSALYNVPLTINQTQTLKAKAFKTGYTASTTASNLYTINLPTVSAPIFNPIAGTYHNNQSITISTETPGAIIRYTTDGTEPTENASLYSNPVVISQSQTLKAKAYKTDYQNSTVTEAQYILQVADPVPSVSANTYSTPQTITFSCATQNSKLFYTLNGTDPTLASTAYTAPIIVNETQTIRIKAFKPGYTPSSTVSNLYTINLPSVSAPTFNPAAGSYSNNQTLTLTSTTQNAIIRYTTNGTEPTDTSLQYSTPISVTQTSTIKAKAYRENYINSPTSEALYALQVADPTVSVQGNTFTSPQTITLSCSTQQAEIYYTLNGTDPTTSSTAYSAPIVINQTQTLKIKAFKTGYTPSTTISNLYTINFPTVSAPSFSPPQGIYNNQQSIVITSTTEGSTIRYTTDGTVPNETSALFTNAITVSQNQTLKAKAFKTNYIDSDVTESSYSFKVADPTVSVQGNTFTTPQTITLSCSTQQAEIFYTLNGTDPTTSSTAYSAPIVINQTQTLKVKAFKTGYTPSTTISNLYTINFPTVSAPSFSPPQGIYNNQQSIVITSITEGSTIRYTTDGTVPNETSALFTNAITVSQNQTLKAKAFKTNYIDSDVTESSYSFKVADPTVSVQGNTFTTPQTITLSCSTQQAEIFYTLNGTDPTTSSTAYSTPIVINQTQTLKIKAFKTGYTSSNTISNLYTINLPVVAIPVINPSAGNYSNDQSITLTTTTPDAQIRYTTDGTEPVISSALYSQPFVLNTSALLKAKAFKTDHQASLTEIANFVFKTALPVLSHVTGTFTSSQTISMTCSTENAQIRYTLNGSDPTANSTLYSGPVTVSETTTLKAKAFRSGYQDSDPVQAIYTINLPTVSSVTFNPAQGTYANDQTVTLSTTTNSAQIRYTLDGSEPSISSTLYQNPLTVNQNTQIKARAFKYDYLDSPTSSAEYSFQSAEPVFSLAEGTYPNSQSLTITCSTQGAVIRYTTDGSNPTSGSSLYSSALTINSNQTVKAMAFKNNYTNSTIKSANYIMKAGNPVFSVVTGILNNPQSVTLTTITQGAEIRYTTNGADPVQTSTLYSGELSISGNQTVKAKAFKTGYQPSDVEMVDYTFQTTDPVFSLTEGIYNNNQTLTLSCTTQGAEIRYTTNGNEPTATSTLYNTEINITGSQVVKAKAFKTGYYNSNTISGNYTLQSAQPVFSITSGTYTNSQTLTLSCSTAGSEIHYSIDGSDPSLSSPLYSSPLTISQTSVIKAVSLKTGYSQSQVSSQSYVINLPTVATVSFYPVGGTYSNDQTITLSTTTTGAQIRYTTDGSIPTTSSTLYSNPITVSSIQTIKVKAYKYDYNESVESAQTYTLNATAPSFNLSAGTYTSTQTVTITSATVGAVIRYTTNGTDPTASSAIYNTPLQISNTTTLKAKAFRTGYNSSAITQAIYTLNLPTVATPVILPAGGTYNNDQTITINSDTEGAEIRYTSDGSTPTASSTLYSGPFTLNNSVTIKAKAFKNDYLNSSESSNTYSLKVGDLTFSVGTGTYNNDQTLLITCPTEGAEIRYTTDGTNPTTSSALYSTGILINTSQTIIARGFKTNYTSGNFKSGAYNFTVADPVFNLESGSYNDPQLIEMTTATQGAEIRYTTDGTTPTQTSTLYQSPVFLPLNSYNHLKAKAFKTGYSESNSASNNYMIGLVIPENFVFVEGGTFQMGSIAGEAVEQPVHQVTISSFLICKFEVTQEEWLEVMNTNISSYQGNNKPVENVSWFGAIEYCNRKSLLEGLNPCYSYGIYGNNINSWPVGWNTNNNHSGITCNWSNSGYRLLTEAEWEFAAKGGIYSQGFTYSGSNDFYSVGWSLDNSGYNTHLVGTKLPNELEIYDMSGNVREWVWDITSDYNQSNIENPVGASQGSQRIWRGGSFLDYTSTCRSTFRASNYPDWSGETGGLNGFRIGKGL